MLEIFFLLLFAVGAWFLWDSLKAREAANVAIRDACKQHGLMFLDDTVGLASLRPARDDQGHAALRRVYRFEYSETGDNRKPGTIILLGPRVLVVKLPVPAPLTIVPSGPTLH
ncbi:MAG: DUF3301 domain-containing protein [Betaproteobacteria bacterium]